MVCFNESGLLRYYFGMCSHCLGGYNPARWMVDEILQIWVVIKLDELQT